MPIVTVTVPEGVFDEGQRVTMIDGVTEAMVSVEGEAFRDKTWVVYDEIPEGRFAIGGTTVRPG